MHENEQLQPMTRTLDKKKIVVFTGAGISAESGIRTFRDANGLWNEYSLEEVASPQAWAKNPQLVLDFYNERRENVCHAQPNEAHEAIVALEQQYEVVVITQNVDDLHERAGSSNIIHVHGEITKARSSIDETLIYDIGCKSISMGDTCELRSQLRPHIVWFGEPIMHHGTAQAHVRDAARILVVGTSLSVYPAAGLLKKASYHAEKVLVSLDVVEKPFGYEFIRAKASSMVPWVVGKWLKGERAI